MNWEALFLTVRLAALSSVLLVLLGLPLAWWLAQTRWRGRALVEAVVALPLVLPPTVLGFYLLLFLGPHGALGKFVAAIFGTRLPFTFAGLVIASVIYSLPFAVQPFVTAFRFVERQMIEAAEVDGANGWQVFGRIGIPLAWPGLVAGVVLSFAHTLGEFGVALMIGGNIAGRTRTISMAIYDEVQALDYRSAALNSVVLVVFSFLVLTIVYALQKSFALQSAGNPPQRG